MKLEQSIRAIAGSFILISLYLGHAVSANWYWFTAFVGANLMVFDGGHSQQDGLPEAGKPSAVRAVVNVFA